LVEVHQKPVRLLIVEMQFIAVRAEERSRDGDGSSFVSINERVILRQAFQKSCSFLNDVGIISSLRPRKRRLERTNIANSERSAKPQDRPAVRNQNFLN